MYEFKECPFHKDGSCSIVKLGQCLNPKIYLECYLYDYGKGTAKDPREKFTLTIENEIEAGVLDSIVYLNFDLSMFYPTRNDKSCNEITRLADVN